MSEEDPNYITKGVRVRYVLFEVEDDASLAGVQMKVSLRQSSGEGVVTGIWSDKPPEEDGEVVLD